MGCIVDDTLYSGMPGTVSTTINIAPLSLDAVPEDTATTVATSRGKDVGGALERIEMVGRSVHRDFK